MLTQIDKKVLSQPTLKHAPVTHKSVITATLCSFSQPDILCCQKAHRVWTANMSVKLGGNILVTGTSRGIGLELVKQLAEKTGQEAHIYASCRDPEGTRAEVMYFLLIAFTSSANTPMLLMLEFPSCIGLFPCTVIQDSYKSKHLLPLCFYTHFLIFKAATFDSSVSAEYC